jgi:hypothetical protein
VQLVGGRLENSLIYTNRFTQSFLSYPPGVYMTGGTMVNCTVSGNAAGATSAHGSGVKRTGGAITNCVIYGNVGANGVNYVGDVNAAAYSCAPELTSGAGNITGDPLFEDTAGGDFRLASDSPAINAGSNLAWTKLDRDLAGNSRLKGATVDMGAYESQPPAGTMFQIR